MTDTADRYRRLVAALAARLDRVPADGWDAPTPCDDWSVRELTRHLVNTQAMFLGFVGRGFADGAVPPVDDDPVGAFAAATSAVQADLDDPTRAAAEFDGFFGRTSFEQAVDAFLCFDLVVHGWDLAHATGQDERIDPADVDRVSAATVGFGDALRSPGVCGPALVPPDGADAQTRLLAFLGRRAWT